MRSFAFDKTNAWRGYRSGRSAFQGKDCRQFFRRQQMVCRGRRYRDRDIASPLIRGSIDSRQTLQESHLGSRYKGLAPGRNIPARTWDPGRHGVQRVPPPSFSAMRFVPRLREAASVSPNHFRSDCENALSEMRIHVRETWRSTTGFFRSASGSLHQGHEFRHFRSARAARQGLSQRKKE